ncbi:MAG: Crp/Fnr family transcriptional regulator [Rhizobiaceae bacterium]|nr:MAG: Crp/Fnr family transcriptional regulator [Rhizobiaceae bacterium]
MGHIRQSESLLTVADEIDAFFNKLERRDALSSEEREALIAAAGAIEVFPAGADLVREGDRPDRSMLVAQGFTTRYRLLADGTRQITAIHLPGDFVDLHSFLLKTMDHSVGALSSCRIVTFPHANLKLITERYPHLTRMLWLMTLLDSAMHREWIVAMGRRSALERLAHLLCEIFTRMSVVGLGDRNSELILPINQTELGDALGLSTVHVNRTLQQMRAGRLISWTGQSVHILDWDRLVTIAEFDDGYLHLDAEPR